MTAKVIKLPHPSCEFICEDCGGNKWRMWIHDAPKCVELECYLCKACYSMPIEE